MDGSSRRELSCSLPQKSSAYQAPPPPPPQENHPTATQPPPLLSPPLPPPTSPPPLPLPLPKISKTLPRLSPPLLPPAVAGRFFAERARRRQKVAGLEARLHEALLHAWPRLSGRVTFASCALEDVEILTGDVVVSSHACGALTDKVLSRAVAASARVAVLPCCHDLRSGDAGGLSGWVDASVAIDIVRATRLTQQGYRIWTQSIPAHVTPKNRLLLGAPVTAGSQPKGVEWLNRNDLQPEDRRENRQVVSWTSESLPALRGNYIPPTDRPGRIRSDDDPIVV